MKCYSDDDTFYKILVTPQIKSVKKSCVYPHNSLPPTQSTSRTSWLWAVRAAKAVVVYPLFSLLVRLLICQNSTNILLTLLSECLEGRGIESREARITNPCTLCFTWCSCLPRPSPLAAKCVCHFDHLAGS